MTIGSESRVAQELWGKRFFIHARGEKKFEELFKSGFYKGYFSHKLNAVFTPRP